jgi:hypothetical protein
MSSSFLGIRYPSPIPNRGARYETHPTVASFQPPGYSRIESNAAGTIASSRHCSMPRSVGYLEVNSRVIWGLSIQARRITTPQMDAPVSVISTV